MSDEPSLSDALDRVLIAVAHAALTVGLLPVFVAAVSYIEPTTATYNLVATAYFVAVMAFSLVAASDVLSFLVLLGGHLRSRVQAWRSHDPAADHPADEGEVT